VLSKEKIAVIPLKKKLVEKLKNFSEIELQEILNFADFLLWQRRKQEVASPPDETGNSQPANMDEECDVHYVGGILVVKASSIKNEKVINWDTIISDMREARIGKLIQNNYVIIDECMRLQSVVE
jgi:hypothetical protein